ncbi:hypothetical protein ACLK2F_09305 [Escherichia coli]
MADTDHEFAAYPAFWSHYRFRQQNTRFNALLHQQLRMTSVVSSLRHLCSTGPHRQVPRGNSRTIADGLASSQTDAYTVASYARYARPTSPTTGTSPSGSDYVIFAPLSAK